MRKKERRFLLLWVGIGISLVSTAIASFSSEEKKQIKHLVEEHLHQHPEIVEKSIHQISKRHEAQKKAAFIKLLQNHQQSLYQRAGDSFLGSAVGKVQMVVFLDPLCGHCHKYWAVLRQAVQQHKSLKIVVKDVAYFGKSSLLFAKLKLAAHHQGKYDVVREALERLKPQEEELSLWKSFQDLQVQDLDLAQLKKDFNDPQTEQHLQENLALAKALEVDAIPYSLIGSEVIRGYVDLKTLDPLLK